MKKALSIEELREKIANHKTRMAMDEVLSCFYSNNMRSAIVMLYSTVVSDLYYKLVDLKDLYKDRGATQILEEIDKKKAANPKSSEWEMLMPSMCMQRNKIIRTEDFAHYEALQTERNLCAHPVIDGMDDLYRPNPAYVQGLIINMMEGLLCKPSFISKDLFNMFVDDIARIKNELVDENNVVKFIETKYLNKIDNPQEEYLLFKQLWKIVFFINDDPCKENRTINYKVLLKLMERNKDLFIQEIHSHPEDFFKDASMPCPTRVQGVITSRWGLLVQFLNKYAVISNDIPADFKIEMDKKINENIELSYIVLYDKEDLFQHVMECATNNQYMMSYSSISYLNDIVKSKFSMDYYYDFVVALYEYSPQFANANWNYTYFLKPIITELSLPHLESLIKCMDTNNQIYNSHEFNNAVNKIKERMQQLNPKFDYSTYTNIPQ